MTRPVAWLILCGVHAVGSMLLWWLGDWAVARLVWRAETWWAQPWTLWSSAWVHLNTPQLILNQFALGALTACAWVLRPPLSATVAWLAAWPLAQASLPLWPHIGYAAGLSGVLHAGVAVLAVVLLARCIVVPKARRWGALLLTALLVKLWMEQAWSHPVAWDSGSEVSVVQALHLTSALWGLLLGALAAWHARDQRVPSRWPSSQPLSTR